MHAKITAGVRYTRHKQNPSRALSYYRKNRDKIAARVDRVRQIIRAAKDKPCIDCGKSYPHYVMEFDHVRGDKRFAVSAYGTRSMQSVMDEIGKCDLVCANCHRFRTFARHCVRL